MKTREQILKERYGFSKGSYDYVPRGSEIFRNIGQQVIYVVYQKQSDGTWDSDYKRATIESITDYDPITMTHLVKYKVEDGELEEFRMIPEGYCYVDKEPDDIDVVKRFLPYSMHCKLIEDELFYERLRELYEKRKTLRMEEVVAISSSKDKAQLLRYSKHIAAVIKMADDDILYFRIHDLSAKHKVGTKYSITLTDGDNNLHKFMADSTNESYTFENGIGELKIIDLISDGIDRS